MDKAEKSKNRSKSSSSNKAEESSAKKEPLPPQPSHNQKDEIGPKATTRQPDLQPMDTLATLQGRADQTISNAHEQMERMFLGTIVRKFNPALVAVPPSELSGGLARSEASSSNPTPYNTPKAPRVMLPPPGHVGQVRTDTPIATDRGPKSWKVKRNKRAEKTNDEKYIKPDRKLQTDLETTLKDNKKSGSKNESSKKILKEEKENSSKKLNKVAKKSESVIEAEKKSNGVRGKDIKQATQETHTDKAKVEEKKVNEHEKKDKTITEKKDNGKRLSQSDMTKCDDVEKESRAVPSENKASSDKPTLNPQTTSTRSASIPAEEPNTKSDDTCSAREDHNPPNTPSSAGQYTTSPPTPLSKREEKAKTAALCLLQGLGVMGKPLLHRSPSHSREMIGSPNNTLLDPPDGDPVPITEDEISKMPDAYKPFVSKSTDSSTTSSLRLQPVHQTSTDIMFKMSLTVGEFVTRPINLRFVCVGDEMRPSNLLVDGRHVWTDEENFRKPLAVKRKQAQIKSDKEVDAKDGKKNEKQKSDKAK